MRNNAFKYYSNNKNLTKIDRDNMCCEINLDGPKSNRDYCFYFPYQKKTENPSIDKDQNSAE